LRGRDAQLKNKANERKLKPTKTAGNRKRLKGIRLTMLWAALSMCLIEVGKAQIVDSLLFATPDSL